MDIKAYINSGILEQFVLGNTSPEESAQIVELSKSHPEIKAEIEAIEIGLLKYAESLTNLPSDSVKDKLMKELGFESDENNEKVELVSNKSIDFKPVYKANKNSYLIAASLLLFGASMLGNIWLYQKLISSQNQVASLTTQNTFLTDNSKSQETKYSNLESKVNILLNPQVKPVKLNGLPLMPKAYATVYWDSLKNEVYLNANDLAATNENEQYQLWAIVDGKPVDAGIFNASDVLSGIVKMKSTKKVTAFAVTIEKKGGSISPTLDRMVLMGAVI